MPIPRLKSRKRVIRIAGAGPSGLAAAAMLAKQGFRVEVHEAKEVVGSRWKRGHQIIENFSQKESLPDFLDGNGIQMNFKADPIRACEIFASGKKGLSFESEEPLGYFVQRGPRPGDLDAALCDQAREAGAEIFLGSQKTAAEVDIAATGPVRVDGMGKERTFEMGGPTRLCVILDARLAQGGYAYLFVSGGLGTLGAAVLRDYGNLDRILEESRARFERLLGIQIPSQGEEARLTANFFLKPRLTDGRTLWAGEAAGFQDYLFGFGIRYALRSGALAARSLIEGEDYERLWKKEIRPSQEIALMNRCGYESLGRALPALFLAGAARASSFRDYLRAWYYPDPLRRCLAAPVARFWKKGRLWVDPTQSRRVN